MTEMCTQEKSPSVPQCDDEGHLVVELGERDGSFAFLQLSLWFAGENLTERYKLLDEIGVGTFGKVR